MMVSQQIFTVIIVHIRHTIHSSDSNQKCTSDEYFRELIRLFLKAGRKDKQQRFTGKSFLKIKTWSYQKWPPAKLSDNKNILASFEIVFRKVYSHQKKPLGRGSKTCF